MLKSDYGTEDDRVQARILYLTDVLRNIESVKKRQNRKTYLYLHEANKTDIADLRTGRRKAVHSTYQAHQVSSNGYNLALMDYHSKYQHVHRSGMPPSE